MYGLVLFVFFWKTRERGYKPEYSMFKFGVKEKSLDPSSNPRRFDIKPGGKEPGPEGDGICLPEAPIPIPGDGARLGGVARPSPESVSNRQAREQGGIRVNRGIQRAFGHMHKTDRIVLDQNGITQSMQVVESFDGCVTMRFC